MSTSTELHLLAISDVYVLIMLELIMQNMVKSNLVDEGSGHIVSWRVDRHRKKGSCGFFRRRFLHHIVFSRHLTSERLVIPKPYSAIFLWACEDQRSVNCNVDWGNLTSMKSFADEIKPYFFVQIFVQTDWLDLNDTYVVVFHWDSKAVFVRRAV